MAEQQPDAETVNPPAAPAAEYSGFGEGDLGRLQGILFGDHAKQTHDRIDTLERALIGAMSDLKDDLASQIKDLAKQVSAEEKNRTKAVSNLADRVDTESQKTTDANKSLAGELSTAADKLGKTIDEAAAGQSAELEAVRRDLQASLEATESGLLDQTVDRKRLATLLTQVAEGLNG